MKLWTVALIVVASILFAASISNEVYGATSPTWLSWHVVLRKFYSIVAFSLVGYLLRRAIVENGGTRVVLRCIVGVAAYSAAIEVAQFLHGSQEGLGWNAFDTFCGAVGGAIAVSDVMLRRASARR